MAIYHMHVSVGTRNNGKSAAARDDYIEREGKYNKRHEEVLVSKSGNMPSWAENQKDFWKASDVYERANGSLYREIEIALPKELPVGEQISIVNEYVETLTEKHKLPYTWGIHINDENNPHAHIMFCERANDEIERNRIAWFSRANSKEPAKGGAKKIRELTSKDWLKNQRKTWEEIANKYLEENYIDERVDCRSLEDQGIDRIPQKHVGVHAWGMEARGITTERGDQYREAKADKIEYEQAQEKIKELDGKIEAVDKELFEINWRAEINEELKAREEARKKEAERLKQEKELEEKRLREEAWKKEYAELEAKRLQELEKFKTYVEEHRAPIPPNAPDQRPKAEPNDKTPGEAVENKTPGELQFKVNDKTPGELRSEAVQLAKSILGPAAVVTDAELEKKYTGKKIGETERYVIWAINSSQAVLLKRGIEKDLEKIRDKEPEKKTVTPKEYAELKIKAKYGIVKLVMEPDDDFGITTGPIVEMTKTYAIQSIGNSNFILHKLKNFEEAPKIGPEILKIETKGGIGKIINTEEIKEKQEERSRGRGFSR